MVIIYSESDNICLDLLITCLYTPLFCMVSSLVAESKKMISEFFYGCLADIDF